MMKQVFLFFPIGISDRNCSSSREVFWAMRNEEWENNCKEIFLHINDVQIFTSPATTFSLEQILRH
jgi:hypothetical protein